MDFKENRIKRILNNKVPSIKFPNRQLSKEHIKVMRELENFERAKTDSINTISNKVERTRDLALFLNKPFDKATKKDIINYMAYINKNHSEGTPNTYAIELKYFYKWFYTNFMKWKPRYKQDYPELVEWIQTGNGNNKTKLPEELLTQDEIKKLVEHSTNIRNKAIIMFLYDGALRVGEVTSLKIKHLVFDEYGGYVTIPKGKTGMRKVRLIDSIPYLKDYLDKEHPDKDNPNSHLFVNVETKGSRKSDIGKRFDDLGIRIMLRRTAIKAGIKKRIYPHLFRHSKLTEMAKDFTEQELKVFAGWTGSSNMPSIYVHLSDSDIGNKILEKKGIIESKTREQEHKLRPIKCIDPRCNHMNPVTNRFCVKCHRPIEVKSIMEIEEKTKTHGKVRDRAYTKHGKIDRETLKEAVKELIKEGEIKI